MRGYFTVTTAHNYGNYIQVYVLNSLICQAVVWFGLQKKWLRPSVRRSYFTGFGA